MDAISAVILLRVFIVLAALYASLRCLADWRDKKKGWAVASLIVALAGFALTFARLPIFEAQIQVQKN